MISIVEELRTNRESGAKRLEAEYKAGLMTLARRFYADEGDAEKLVNRTLAEVIAGIDAYLEQSAFFGWMCKILENQYSKDVRRKSNRTIVEAPEAFDAADDADAANRIFREVDAAILRDAIATLPDDMKDALMLRYFMDMPVGRVAKILSVPEGTVKWRLHCARLTLAAKLGAAAKKPGGRAVLLALALCGFAALGAAVWNLGWGEPSRRADAPAWTGEGTDGTGGTGGAGLHPFNFSSEQSTEQPQQETSSMTIRTRSAALGAASALALASAPSAASGDEYQFIVSGDTAAAATAGVVEAESTAGPLDVRHHAVAESRAMALSSIKNGSFVIVVR